MKHRSCFRALQPIHVIEIIGCFWSCCEGKVCRPDLVGNCIAPQVEPPATPCEMHPSLGKPTFRVCTYMKIFCPFAVGHGVGIRVSYPGLSSVTELSFIAHATVWTRNIKHIKIFSERPPPLHVRRSGGPI